MGNKSSNSAGRNEANLEPLVVEFSTCRNVPHVDLFSPSDPFIKAYIMTPDSKGRFRKIGKCRRTLHRDDADHPVFTAFRSFTTKVDPVVDRLWIEVWDVDPLRNELIGRAVIKIADISDQPRWYNVARAKPSTKPHAQTGFQVKLRRVPSAERAPAQRKGFFLVRHGESKWNEAQRDRDVGTMMAFDHGLTAAGVQQALTLNKQWKAAVAALQANDAAPDPAAVAPADAPYVRHFAGADKAFSSPLTRAIETALLVLRGHATVEGAPDATDEAGDLKHETLAVGVGAVETADDVAAVEIIDELPASPKAEGSDLGTAVGAAGALNDDDDDDADTAAAADEPPVGTADTDGGSRGDAVTASGVTNGRPAAGAATGLPAVAAETDAAVDYSLEKAKRLTLASRIREVKNIGGLDTVGKVTGEAVMPRVRAELASVYPLSANDTAKANSSGSASPKKGGDSGVAATATAPEGAEGESAAAAVAVIDAESPTAASSNGSQSPEATADSAVAAAAGAGDSSAAEPVVELTEAERVEAAEVTRWMDAVEVNLGDATAPWWTPGNTYDSEKNIQSRIEDWLDFVRFHEAQTPVFVGHSLFFKAFYSRRMSAAFKRAKPELAAKMAKHKLGNAVMMYVEVDFSGKTPEITDAHILFGGGFHEH